MCLNSEGGDLTQVKSIWSKCLHQVFKNRKKKIIVSYYKGTFYKIARSPSLWENFLNLENERLKNIAIFQTKVIKNYNHPHLFTQLYVIIDLVFAVLWIHFFLSVEFLPSSVVWPKNYQKLVLVRDPSMKICLPWRWSTFASIRVNDSCL